MTVDLNCRWVVISRISPGDLTGKNWGMDTTRDTRDVNGDTFYNFVWKKNMRIDGIQNIKTINIIKHRKGYACMCTYVYIYIHI